jgi:hypothetical protein
MSKKDIRKLPPMTALEFAIEQTFRNFFYSLRLALGWAMVQAPLFIAAYFLAFRSGMPDFRALPPAAMAVFIAIAVVSLLASFSIAVNWHRRILLNETPRRFGWLRLDGVVWRYIFGFLVVLVVLAIIGGAIFAALTWLPSALEPKLGPASANVAKVVAALLGLIALFTWYRLSTWLPAIATRNKDYGFGTAWRTTRRNSMRYLGFTFWLLFGLAIAAGIGAGAFFGQQALNDPWATVAAFVLIGILAWLALFLVMTIATSHYFHFTSAEAEEEAENLSEMATSGSV